jgi:hypothetical protein
VKELSLAPPTIRDYTAPMDSTNSHPRAHMRLILIILALCVAAPFAAADEGENAIKSALKAYRTGRTLEAKHQLDKASIILAALLTKRLQNFLPKPLEGWQVEDSDTPSEPTFVTGGLNASRSYSNSGARVTISISGDVPVLAAMAFMFVDATRAKEAGNRVTQIKGNAAIVTGDGQVQILVANRFLVIAEGDASEADKEAFLDKIDVAALSKL